MYLFKGWSENKDATQIQYANDAIYKQDKSIRLYAVWSEVVASTTIDGVTTNYDSSKPITIQIGRGPAYNNYVLTINNVTNQDTVFYDTDYDDYQ